MKVSTRLLRTAQTATLTNCASQGNRKMQQQNVVRYFHSKKNVFSLMLFTTHVIHCTNPGRSCCENPRGKGDDLFKINISKISIVTE
jgi:hypothetical protein